MSQSVPISARLNNETASLQALHRDMLMKVLSSIRFLARQGLPLRGHNDDVEGNVHQILLLRADDDARLRKWISNNEYTSPSTVNEMITRTAPRDQVSIVVCYYC